MNSTQRRGVDLDLINRTVVEGICKTKKITHTYDAKKNETKIDE